MKKLGKRSNWVVVFVLISIGVSFAQQTTQKGVVKDLSGIPLIGATVQVKGSSNGTITDNEGKFSLEVKSEDVIAVSYIGYVSQEIKAQSGKILLITLNEDTKKLNEVVVVGFGTQKKVNLTGSVGVVNSDVLDSRPVQNALQALEGVSPGLNISYTNGGALNAQPEINIRGIATIGQGSTGSALVLIDGMEGDLASINPQDIESISILKDAAASSIYGSRAPFGVILVTTKQSKGNKTIINYDFNYRVSTPLNLPKMMDSYSFATYFNAASNNAGQGDIFDPERMQRIWNYEHGKITTTTIQQPNSVLWGDGYDYGNDNIDYYKVMYKNSTPSQEHNLSFSGGKGKTNFYISANYLNQDGFIAYGKDNFQRFSTNAKTNSLLNKWLSLNINFKFSNDNHTQPSHLSNQLYDDMARQFWPTKPLYDPNGNLYDDHLIGLRDGGKQNTENNWLYQQAQFIITPAKKWRILLESNYRLNYQHQKTYYNTYYQLDTNGNPGNIWQQNTSLNEYYYFNNYFSNNIYSDYEFSINESHKFKFMAGFQSEINHFNDIYANRLGLLNSDDPSINTTTGVSNSGTVTPPNISGQYTEWSTAGFFGRIDYDYKSKYLFEANLRYDGSSRFQKSNRWGLFPSISVGWNIAEETFFNPIKKYINYLKFRGSYGSLGNENTSSIYPTYSAMNIGMANGDFIINQQKPNVASPPALISSSLTWEKIGSYNAGLDYGMFRNRLTGSFDSYIRYTKDMVGPSIELPAALGTVVPLANNTDLKTWGFEIEIGWKDHLKNGIGYSAKFTLSDSQTKILRYSNPTNSLTQYREGQMMGEIWGYTTLGIAKNQEEMDKHLATLSNGGQNALGTNWSAGDIMYKDINGDGKIDWGENTSKKPGDVSVIGNSTPRYIVGFDFSIEYKGFDFRTFLQGVLKRDVFVNGYYFWGAAGGDGKWFSTGFVEHENYFRDDPNQYGGLNLDSYYPRPLFGTTKNQQVQTRYLQDGRYIRLKNLQLGYSLPNSILKELQINKVRFFVSGENLLTFSKMIKIFDPETANGGPWSKGNVYPLSTVYSCGLSVTF